MQEIEYIGLDSSAEIPIAVNRVADIYPVRISSYYAGLIREPGDAISRQCMPDERELDACGQVDDPLAEHAHSPVDGLIHRYPDRVVLLVSNRCAVYCRFCMRKRLVGSGDAPLTGRQLDRALEYIARHPAIRDVVLSGGDPLMLSDASLDSILRRLRAIPHVSIIRIGSRVPVTLPMRVTPELCRLLSRYQPLYVNTHFNHPSEITEQSSRACALMADAGIALGNQTVLLRGVNDSVETMAELFRGLLAIRVRPYYLHQMDLVRGTAHFRTPVQTGLDIIRGIRGHLSGLAVPHFVIDLPGGKGKVALTPEDVRRDGETLLVRNYLGETVAYPDIREIRE